jgi:hypothetical protein
MNVIQQLARHLAAQPACSCANVCLAVLFRWREMSTEKGFILRELSDTGGETGKFPISVKWSSMRYGRLHLISVAIIAESLAAEPGGANARTGRSHRTSGGRRFAGAACLLPGAQYRVRSAQRSFSQSFDYSSPYLSAQVAPGSLANQPSSMKVLDFDVFHHAKPIISSAHHRRGSPSEAFTGIRFSASPGSASSVAHSAVVCSSVAGQPSSGSSQPVWGFAAQSAQPASVRRRAVRPGVDAAVFIGAPFGSTSTRPDRKSVWFAAMLIGGDVQSPAAKIALNEFYQF